MRHPATHAAAFLRGALAVPAAILLLAGPAAAATAVVSIGQNGTNFVDQTSGSSTTTIHVGDTVQWNWASGPHSTTAGTCTTDGYYGNCTPDGSWDSGQNSQGHSFSRAFAQAGTFTYYCSVHLAMMRGTVMVLAGDPPAASFRVNPTGPIAGSAVRFIDTSTGAPTSWAWSFGDPASGSDNTSTLRNPTHTFQAAGTYTVMVSATNASGTASSTTTVAVSAGGATTCVVDAGTLCLNDGRFRLTAVWQKTDGSSGPGKAVSLTSDSGYFWFFDQTNIEMVTKVLNACAVDGNYWVFTAGLTNVKVTVTVLDTSNGISEQYVNPLGTAFQPIQDTSAFATCP